MTEFKVQPPVLLEGLGTAGPRIATHGSPTELLAALPDAPPRVSALSRAAALIAAWDAAQLVTETVPQGTSRPVDAFGTSLYDV